MTSLLGNRLLGNQQTLLMTTRTTPTTSSRTEEVRLHLRLGYAGTAFHGWAVQPHQRTVQGEVERALVTVLRLPQRVPVVCAGRTDAGVHASDQHVHLDVPRHVWPGADLLVRRLNGVLPPDVRVLSAQVAAPGFDARFSVRWRQYRYTVSDAAVADPLTAQQRWHRPRPLDVPAMNQWASTVLGEHDFAALCRRRPDASTIRTILALQWHRQDCLDGHSPAVMTVRADAFCHSMVRSLVGLMVLVGDHSRTAAWASDVVAARSRRPEVVVAPPHGLVLERVHYADDLAAQAARARRYRG